MGRVWLIGGTQESASLAVLLSHNQIPCTVSVTTESARSLYPNSSMVRVWVGRLTVDSLNEFLREQQIAAVVDASHPFAVEISQVAIAACEKLQIPYLRYERPVLEEEGGGVVYVDDFDTIFKANYLENQRVLLTVGYKPLHLFLPWQKRATLFARLLPSVVALDAAFDAGFTSDRLICLRPPVSVDLEMALWRRWGVSLVVSKASGSAGGEDVKRQVASELGVILILVSRPEVVYPQQTSDFLVVLGFCERYFLNRR
ncbi:cobalt-precorrin-6A reductase [Scytonema hofmannii PCC 7110]|uniref:Cobalt-precorrin-6A reductase n=1 Tax=Scytonema hofmannii PCC 7110 TaxID=128403 RepID=A0A139XAI4_9CYAN|nr:cobalt-precorrin-6A reductase [Scytonema hofmannii]KYC41700.1 cobalt-precorrin-6A reductase [Scytonema hofmannii PCC 7110]